MAATVTAVSLVTGASSGLGRATAQRLAADGYVVGLLARHRPDLERVADQIAAAGGSALPAVEDLADPEATAAAYATVSVTARAPSVLVNAAGTDVPGPATRIGVGGFDRVLRVNLTAAFPFAALALPAMTAAGTGTGLIVNVSPVAGRRGWANASAYCASKFAQTGLTHALAAEARPTGLRVVVVYPGAMRTAWGPFPPRPCHPGHESEPRPEDARPRQTLLTSTSSRPPHPAPDRHQGQGRPPLERGCP